MLRQVVCCMLVAAIPTLIIAADSGATVQGKGVIRNGTEVPFSFSAVFPGDLLQTPPHSIANLNLTGSSVVIYPTSLVEFQGQAISLEHGAVTVATSHGIGVRAGCMMIVPATSAWTQFAVSDVNGTIEIAARKNDVKLQTMAESTSSKEISSDGGGSSLHEGQGTSRDESDGCKGGKRKGDAGAVPAGQGGILNSDYLRYGALSALGGTGLWLALQDDDPASPSIP